MGSTQHYQFRLYVAGDSPSSGLAMANLTAMCEEHFAGRHGIEVIDVFREPKLALAAHISTAPTLVKLAPGPMRHVVGTLADTKAVLRSLGVEGPET